MGYLYHGQRIYHNPETGYDTVHPVSFLWDDVLELRGSKGQHLPFVTPGGKTYVMFAGERGMWVQEQISEMRSLWEDYMNDGRDADDTSGPGSPSANPKDDYTDFLNPSPN